MSETNPIIKQLRESAGFRLAVLFGSFVVCLTISSIINSGIDLLNLGDSRTKALISSVIQGLMVFCIPSFILARFSSDSPLSWLKLDTPLSFRALFGVLLIYLISLPAMEWLIAWNNSIHLPDSMSSLENMLRKWEEANNNISNTLLNASGFLPILTGVLIIGIFTGFVEELFFRGGVQGICVRTNMGTQSAIWIAAFVFSFMHFQFFGFLPRLLMGAFFGYLLIWTKDIKISMFAHILNNTIVVVTAGLTGVENVSETSIIFTLPYMPIISVALTVIYLVLFRNYFFKDHYKLSLPWQKNQLPPVSGR